MKNQKTTSSANIAWKKPVTAAILSTALAFAAPTAYAQGMPEEPFAAESSAFEVSESDFKITDGVLEQYNGRDTEVILPDGITAIGDKAFFNSRVQSVTIPAGVTSIGESAFEACSRLSSVIFPTGLTEIKDMAFRECGSLTALALPEGLTQIGEEAVSHCANLASITLPASLVSIGDYAFTDCPSLTSIALPANVAAMGIGVFSDCPSLESVAVSASITAIRKETFSNCANLVSVSLPEGLSAVEDQAFDNCSSLESITLSEKILNIGENVFRNCEKLTIYGVEGSYAHTYAQSQNIPFSPIGQPPVVEPEPEPELKQLTASLVTLSQSSYIYDGKAKTPAVTVQYGGEKLKEGTDFTATYKNNTNAGTATVTITGIGSYTSTVAKNFSIQKASQKFASYTKTYSKPYGSKAFTLNAKLKTGNGKLAYTTSNKKVAVVKNGKVTIKGTGSATITVQAGATANYNQASVKITIKAAPAKQAIKSLKTAKGRKLTVSWKKDARATGYQIQYSTDKQFKKSLHTITVAKNKAISRTIPKLTEGKSYYIRVRSYKTAKVNGKSQKLTGAWSSPKKSSKVKK